MYSSFLLGLGCSLPRSRFSRVPPSIVTHLCLIVLEFCYCVSSAPTTREHNGNSLLRLCFVVKGHHRIMYKEYSCIFNCHFCTFLTNLYVLCSFLYWNMLQRTVDAALAALTFPELKEEKGKKQQQTSVFITRLENHHGITIPLP